MYSKHLLMLGLTTLAISCGHNNAGSNNPTSTETSNSSVIGVWKGTRQLDSIRYDFRVKIEKDRVTESAVCTFADGSILNSPPVTVAAQVGASMITILESKSDSTGTMSHYCGVALSAREIPFQIIQDKLTVTNLNQDQNHASLTDHLTKLSL